MPDGAYYLKLWERFAFDPPECDAKDERESERF